MGCFSAQRRETRRENREEELLDKGRELTTPPLTFKSRARAIQNAQRFINRSSCSSNSSSSTNNPRVRIAATEEVLAMPSSAIITTTTTASTLASGLARPLPLPSPPSPQPGCYRLPLPQSSAAVLSSSSSFNVACMSSSSATTTATTAVLGHLKKPFPPTSRKANTVAPAVATAAANLTSFTYEDIVSACCNFSPDCCLGEIANADFFYGTAAVDGSCTEVNLLRLRGKWRQGYREWVSELSAISQRRSAHLCKLVGCSGGELQGSLHRVLVYERPPKSGHVENGTLSLIMGNGLKGDSLQMDWPSRVKIAAGAAQGLAYLHETFPNKVPYREFRRYHIQVDANFSARLSGYSIDGYGEIDGGGCCPPELVPQVSVTEKSNVWGFGVVLLELITGRTHMDLACPPQERNLVRWTRPFLQDQARLFLAMDPKLHGKFPLKAAKMVADLALQCLNDEPHRRPAMRHVSDMLLSIRRHNGTAAHLLSKDPSPAALFYVTSSPSSPSPPSSSSSSSSSSPRASSPPSNQHHACYYLATCSQMSTGSNKVYDNDALALRSQHPTKNDVIEGPPLPPLIIPKQLCTSTCALKDPAIRRKRQLDLQGSLSPLEA